MENIEWKEIRRGRGRRTPGDRRRSCAGYAGPERRSGRERRLAQGFTTCVVADSLDMGAAEEATAEVHGRRLTDRLNVQETALPKRRYSLSSVQRAIKKITPAHIRAVKTATGETQARTQPKALKTHYSTIYYDNVGQLYSFSEAIEGNRRTARAAEGGEPKGVKKGGKLGREIKGFFSRSARILRGGKKAEGEKAPTAIKRLQSMKLTQERVDTLVRRVSTILHLDPPNLHVSIYLYNAYDEVAKAYKELGHTGKAARAFYSLKSRAVYLPVDGLTDAIFAHEIAHAIINAAYPLPLKLRDILAHYVYNHLQDE
jgi:hypothetical protein